MICSLERRGGLEFKKWMSQASHSMRREEITQEGIFSQKGKELGQTLGIPTMKSQEDKEKAPEKRKETQRTRRARMAQYNGN